MAAKPLKLKRERPKTIIRSRRFQFTAEVLIDHDLIHLDQPFTYGIPEDLLESLSIGARVIVPFNGREVEGVVLEIQEVPDQANKPILKVLSSRGYSSDTLNFASEIAQRYATTIVKVLRYIPELPPSFRDSDGQEGRSLVKAKRRYLSLSNFEEEDLKEKLHLIRGDSYLIYPTERQASEALAVISEAFPERTVKGFGKGKVRNSFPERAIVVGTRSLIMWQNRNLDYIAIFHDSSDHLWSDRNPYWNVRDVALLRSRLGEIDLDFVAGFPSLELARLIELGYLEAPKTLRARLFKRRGIRTLPATYHETIREGLKGGVVLVQVAQKDYSSLAICKRCRCRPICECGFALKLTSKSKLTCTICQREISEWRCHECGSKDMLLISRGAKRIEEELGKAFPFVPIYLSTSEKPLVEFPSAGIVVATPGMEPRGGKFSALALLDGELQLNWPTMRTEERLLDLWFTLVTKCSESAPIYLTLPSNHRISQALSIGSPDRLMREMLAERKDVRLPPWYRVARIKGEDLSTIQLKLSEEFDHLVLSKSSDPRECLIRVPVERSQEVIDSIHALIKYRLATGKEPISVEIDPYEL